ncbi:MAG: ATP-binding protein [Clostridiaceae bacterium]
MSKVNEKKYKNLKDIISIVKLITLILTGIFSLKYFYNRFNFDLQLKFSDFKAGNFLVTLSVFITVYFLWLIIEFNNMKLKNIKKYQACESIFFIVIFTIFIIISKNSIPQYKYLYIFVIIIATIEIGMKFGIITSSISSVIIIFFDIYFLKDSIINQLFENDLIIISVFILTSLTLGYYVELEKSKLEEKEYRLNELSNEVKEENIKVRHLKNTLLKNQACYDLLIEHAKDAIVIHRNNKILFVNSGAKELFGYEEKGNIANNSIVEIYSDEDKENIRNIFSNLQYASNSRVLLKSTILGRSKKEVYVESTSTSFIYQGEATILTLFRDISYEKEVKKLQDHIEENIKMLNESREYSNTIIELNSNISHEIKTPLNLIYSSIQLLEVYENNDLEEIADNSTIPKEVRKKYFAIMKQNCFRLLRLINNLLDVSKSDSGFLKLHPTNVDIVSVVETLTLSVVPYGESKGVTIIFDTEIEEKIIACDSDKMERVILNILSNAIKFTDSNGNIFVNIMESNDYVSISIKDTGVGIQEDRINDIFNRYSQVDSTIKRNREGTGLGLSIVKSFVEMHNGTIQVKSKYNEGSEFVINLPNILIDGNEEESNFYVSNIDAVNTEFSDLYK